MSVKAARQTEFQATVDRLLALDDSARREYVSRPGEQDWSEFVSALADRVREEVRADVLLAHRLADLCITIAEAIGKPIPVAKSFRAKANAHYAVDQHAAAIELHRQAASIFEQQGDDEELARTLSGSIQPLLLLGNYEQALATAERAR